MNASPLPANRRKGCGQCCTDLRNVRRPKATLLRQNHWALRAIQLELFKRAAAPNCGDMGRWMIV